MRFDPKLSVLLGTCTLAALSCSSSDKADSTRIKVGFLYSTEGFFGAFEPSYVDAARLAAELINEQGGPLDREIEIVPRNFAGKVAEIDELAQELVDEGAVAMIGPLVSPYSEALATRPEDSKIPTFVLTSDLVFNDAPYVFNMLATQADHAAILASRAVATGQMSMAIVYERTLSRAEQVLENEYTARGGRVVGSFELTIEDKVDELLAEIMATPPDVITLVATPTLGAGVLNRYLQTYAPSAVDFRMWPTLCIADFALGVPGVETLSHEIISTSFQSGAEHDAFTKAYKKRFPSNLLIGHSTFDAVYALALAVEGAGKADGALVRDALPLVTRGGTPYSFLEYAQARDALRAGKDVDFAGTSHGFDYGEDGRLERNSVEFVLCHYTENGKQVFGTKPFTIDD